MAALKKEWKSPLCWQCLLSLPLSPFCDEDCLQSEPTPLRFFQSRGLWWLCGLPNPIFICLLLSLYFLVTFFCIKLKHILFFKENKNLIDMYFFLDKRSYGVWLQIIFGTLRGFVGLAFGTLKTCFFFLGVRVFIQNCSFSPLNRNAKSTWFWLID